MSSFWGDELNMTMFQGLNKINMMCISSHLFESGVDNGTMNLAKPLEMIIRFNHHLGRVFLVHFLTIQWFLSHLQRHLLLSSSSSTQVRFSLQGPTTSLGEAEPIRGSWKKRGSTLGSMPRSWPGFRFGEILLKAWFACGSSSSVPPTRVCAFNQGSSCRVCWYNVSSWYLHIESGAAR